MFDMYELQRRVSEAVNSAKRSGVNDYSKLMEVHIRVRDEYMKELEVIVLGSVKKTTTPVKRKTKRTVKR